MARHSGGWRKMQVLISPENDKEIDREWKRRKREHRGLNPPTKAQVVNDIIEAGLRKGPKSALESVLQGCDEVIFVPFHSSGSAVA
jgi:hypothetical protein